MPTTSPLITALDRARLGTVIERANEFGEADRRYVDDLTHEIERAAYVEPTSVPADVVTMNSTVRLRDLKTDESETYTIVYPQCADIARNRVSILAPLATGILGHRVGETINWRMPGGPARLLIEELIFQPERAGVFEL
jgi:regulator of nucleoside diphosphate kinase